MEPDGNPSDFAKVLDYAKKKHGFEPYGGKYDVPRGVQTEYAPARETHARRCLPPVCLAARYAQREFAFAPGT